MWRKTKHAHDFDGQSGWAYSVYIGLNAADMFVHVPIFRKKRG
ncbi:hypothetical protein B4168_3961 [Anoxybacillus flavithermus]|nr:hypothetical protein B4168_3961 [Anoxybacillus flavithermus]OAO84803.1 hypothetical protein GT23_3317 [Parageobacillus thermoglucosidasius]